MHGTAFFDGWTGRLARIAVVAAVSLLACAGNAVAQSDPPSGCTITATPPTLSSAGGTVGLSVACTGGGTPTGYSWVRVNASGGQTPVPGGASTTDTLPPNTGTVSAIYGYVVTITSAEGIGVGITVAPVVVLPLGGTAPALAGCTIAARPSSVSPAGGRVDLTVACSAGTAARTSTWNRCVGDPSNSGNNGSCVAIPGSGLSNSDTLPPNQTANTIVYVYIAVVQDANENSAPASSGLIYVAPGQAPPTPPTGCAISPASTALPSTGGNVALAVACTGGATPTGYAWTRNGTVVAGATGATLTDSVPANTGTSAQTYTYAAAVSSAGNAAVAATPATVVVAPVAATPPTGCAVSATPSSLPAAGGSVTLSVACTGGATPTSYAWTKNGSVVAGATGPTLADTLPANTATSAQTYAYAATVNSAGNAGVAATPVTVSVGAAIAAASVTPAAGTGQTGQPGQPLPTDFVVDVRDANGNPVPDGTQVTWSVTPAGTGSFSVNPSATVAGRAATRFTVGPEPGTRTVAATSNAQTATFTVTVAANPDVAPVVQQTATVQQQVAIGAARAQIANVRTRLDQLRLQSNPAVAQGLRLSYGGKPLPWQLLADAATPTRSDATPAPADPFERNGIYIQGDVEVGHQSAVGTAAGFDLRTKGLTLGVDRRFDGNNVLGAALGLLRSDTTLRDDGGAQDAKGYSFSIYGSYSFAENGYVNLIGNVGRNDYNGSRNISSGVSASSSTNGTQYGIALSAGYDFYRDALSIGPYARVEYVHAKIDPFTETGVASEAALTMSEQDTNVTFISLGGQLNWAISTSWGVLQPNARLEWQYQASGNSNAVSANFGTAIPQPVEIAGQDKSYGLGSVGVQLILPYSVQAYFTFESPFGKSNYSGQRYTLGVRVGF